jgi:hypothetical protein
MMPAMVARRQLDALGRQLVNSIPFYKDALYRVEGLKAACFTDFMEVTNNRAVELSKYQILAARVGRHINIRCAAIIQEVSIHCGNRLNADRRRQIKTEAHLDRRTHHKWFFNLVRLALPPSLQLLRKFQAASRVCFPEVDSWSKPIVVVLTGNKRGASDQGLANIAVTPVISKDECTGKSMQLGRGPIAFSQLTAFGD